MNKDIKALWVAELRNPNVRQGKGQLRTYHLEETRFCCLGVLCNLHAIAHPEIAAKQVSNYHYMLEVCLLPNAVVKWAGLTSKSPDVIYEGGVESLTCLNDEGITFAEIADVIEKQL